MTTPADAFKIADLVITVTERLAKLAAVAFKAAQAGDDRSVDEILPDPDDYPDEHAYQRIKAKADADYGPPST